jgi:RimJ/RimL family protein N-acetyltransferase
LAVHLTVRPFTADDIAGYMAYLTQMPAADAERIGLAVDRLPPPGQMRADLTASLTEPIDRVRSFMLAWCVDGTVIGHSSLKDIVAGESGRMHLHVWRSDLRGKGYGPRFFCIAALDFYERFRVRSIVCEPKADNPMPNRMLRKIGFPLLKTYVGASSELSVVCEVNCYDIRRDVAERYLTLHPPR